MKEVPIEYGESTTTAKVPDDAVVVWPGKFHSEPPPVDPESAVKSALENPLKMQRISELVKRGDKVVIAFPDKVKGGMHPKAHRRVTIPLVLKELEKAGVDRKDILLICANGLHRKNTKKEIAAYLGEQVVREFWPERMICHDAEDPDRIVELGESEYGDYVDVNGFVKDADLTIMLGHTQPNPYGGHSGGYKTLVTGLTTWRSIGCHHDPEIMYNPDFLPVTTHSTFRKRVNAIGRAIEDQTGKEIFTIDAVVNTRAEILGVYAGRAEAVQEESWKLADKRTQATCPKKADVLVFGLPRVFHYGPGHGTNPILILQAIAATMTRCFGAFKEGGIIIAPSLCNGWFNDEWFPSYREVYNFFQKVTDPEELVDYEESVSNEPEYIYKYRYSYGYHPFHAFSMLYCGGLAWRHCGEIFIPGARAPGIARSIGCTPTKTFDEAWKKAEKIVGKDPDTIVLPEYLTHVPLHLTTA